MSRIKYDLAVKNFTISGISFVEALLLGALTVFNRNNCINECNDNSYYSCVGFILFGTLSIESATTGVDQFYKGLKNLQEYRLALADEVELAGE